MGNLECTREAEVIRAARSGAWSAELRSHGAQCGACGEVALVVDSLVKERRRQIAGDSVADAGLVWWRAQLNAQHKATQRATRPIAVVETLTLVFATAAGTLALGQVWPQLEILTPSLSARAVSTLSALGTLSAFAAASVVVSLLLGYIRSQVKN